MRDLSVELMRLYKLKKYTVWNAVNVLFNKTPEDPEKFKKVLLLSEMIIRNTLKTTDVKSRDGRGYQWVLIEILCREGKFEEAEKEVEERMANYVMSQKLLDERVFQRTLLRELHREEEILPLMEEDIKSGRKLDWDAILFYVDSVCALLGDEALPRLEQFVAQTADQKATRELWLLRLEVCARAVQAGRKEKAALAQLVREYVAFIGHKPCCYSDLERWLDLLRDDERSGEEGVSEIGSISVMTEMMMEHLDLTICVVKGDELLRGVQLKITAIQIALFLRIPINEPFLKELYHMYASSSSSTVATLPCFRSTPTPAPPRRFSPCTGFRSLSRSVSTTRRRSCAGWRRSAASARPWRCWRSSPTTATTFSRRGWRCACSTTCWATQRAARRATVGVVGVRES